MMFGDKWCAWMEALMFNSSLSVLVNRSPKKDFKVTRGLRQGYPISPFLLIFIAKGFAGLLYQMVALGEFEPFHLNDSIDVELL